MCKVIRGLYEIQWTKSPVLRTYLDLVGPAQALRGNRLRLLKEALESRESNKFSKSVTLKQNFSQMG